MSRYLYLSLLLVSSAGMVVLDWKYSLAFFRDARHTTKILLIAVVLFLVWDALGIMLGIFYSGASPYMLGWYLAPELPVEELCFLTFLCYFTLIAYLLGDRLWRRT